MTTDDSDSYHPLSLSEKGSLEARRTQSNMVEKDWDNFLQSGGTDWRKGSILRGPCVSVVDLVGGFTRRHIIACTHQRLTAKKGQATLLSRITVSPQRHRVHRGKTFLSVGEVPTDKNLLSGINSLGRRPESFWRIGTSRFSRRKFSSVTSVSRTSPGSWDEWVVKINLLRYACLPQAGAMPTRDSIT
jgi:hypothetical protein